MDVGALTKIRIGHDNKGVGAAWFLDKVIYDLFVVLLFYVNFIVKVVVSNEKRGSWTITCNKWFDVSQGDKLIVRDLPVDTVGGQGGTKLQFQLQSTSG